MSQFSSIYLILIVLLHVSCGEDSIDRENSIENTKKFAEPESDNGKRLELLDLIKNNSSFLTISKNKNGDNILVKSSGNIETIERFRRRLHNIDLSIFFESGAEGVVIHSQGGLDFGQAAGNTSVSYIPVYDGLVEIEMEGKKWSYSIGEIYGE